MKSFTYLAIDFACILIPFLASFYRKHPFNKEWKYFFPASIMVALPFLIWDYIFTENEIWGFNPDYLTGIYIFNLPIEEVLFFICIPYACIFTYFVFKKYIDKKYYHFLGRYPLYVLLAFSIIATFLFFEKYYTFYTALFLSLSLLFVWLKKLDLNLIFITYLSIIPFFLLSNGILTGSFLDKPIVWYNDHFNLQIRIFTIPIEDTFYGFLLILLNILMYERLKTISFKKLKIEYFKY